MTEKRVYQLATDHALMRWAEARQKVNEQPNSRIWAHRENERWAEYNELSRKLAAIEAAEAE